MTSLAEDYDRLTNLGAEVLAISADSLSSHQRFSAKLGGLPFALLSDLECQVIRAYGVLNDKGTGARRSLFVIGRDGLIYHANSRYELAKVEQYEAAVAALRTLAGS